MVIKNKTIIVKKGYRVLSKGSEIWDFQYEKDKYLNKYHDDGNFACYTLEFISKKKHGLQNDVFEMLISRKEKDIIDLLETKNQGNLLIAIQLIKHKLKSYE